MPTTPCPFCRYVFTIEGEEVACPGCTKVISRAQLQRNVRRGKVVSYGLPWVLFLHAATFVWAAWRVAIGSFKSDVSPAEMPYVAAALSFPILMPLVAVVGVHLLRVACMDAEAKAFRMFAIVLACIVGVISVGIAGLWLLGVVFNGAAGGFA